MKTKIFKTGLPIMAFLMAIAFAFATETNVKGEAPLITGYVIQNGVCTSAPKDCVVDARYDCKYMGLQVYNLEDGETTCRVKLFQHTPN
ncbi:DUF6520 family protein [Moheibacter lacus]|uniref:Uncharacterized protein n=1 Tax=Moheibacter lacus TaxID=2745851 RepID=A0A838ZTM0_9FLAO|nr:DUF6520 family protein [Moheibacter lacus]MBA5630327.1 hypothetical protein [Moheibacter lacus]